MAKPVASESEQQAFVGRAVKIELRKRMRALRRTAPLASCFERSQAIVLRLEAIDTVVSARSVALFWPIEAQHEVDLRSFDCALRARGARVAYPRIDPDSGGMEFRFVDDLAEFVDGDFGLREPPPHAPEAPAGALDVVVVPALAVDPTGHRIGYGGGYYDRVLPRYFGTADTIAVAFDYQLVVEVPVTAGDAAVDWVVTDRRTLDTGRSCSPEQA